MKTSLRQQIEQWAEELGFQAIGFSNTDLTQAEKQLNQWLDKSYQGDMDWMQKHGTKRTRPAELVDDTCTIISARMDYLPPDAMHAEDVLNHPNLAYISRYALGRDYHKILRKQLQKLANRIQQALDEEQADNAQPYNYRVFVDSAPVMEKPIAAKAGLGWVGKHTNILSRDAGSWFFLGEIYTNIPLEKLGGSSEPVTDHCGECTACIDVCPTQAIVAPHVLDARRCISYLTIEHKGSIPEAFRQAIGNRIYGCDDCQLICPWNRFAQTTPMDDFATRHQLDASYLLDLFNWTEEQFLKNMEGSAIRRIGYEKWQRNIAVALGNAPGSQTIIATLKNKLPMATELVKEHIEWALAQHQ